LETKTTVYHGAGQDPAGFDEYREALGASRSPVLYMTYVGLGREPHELIQWGRDLQAQLEALGHEDVMPQIGLHLPKMTDGHREANDEQIEAFCRSVKTLGRRAFVRIGYEFEGHWNRYLPEPYKATFIRITKALRRHQVPAATVWCSAGRSAGVSFERVMAYYPGDQWVDWWGIDLFSVKDVSGKQTRRFCDAAVQHRKPVMIGESTPRRIGVLEGRTSWNKWFAPFFTLIRERPEIKAFCYINWEWAYWSDKTGHKWHDWGDGRIQRNANVTQRYRDEMDRPLYEHAKP
jgi:hypothetical protein